MTAASISPAGTRPMDLPQLTEDQPAHRPFVAAHAVPWPGEMAVFRSPSTDGFELLTTFGSRARIGALVSDFFAGPAEDLTLLQEGSAIGEMLADYAVMREQARACHEATTVTSRR
jgi:hypothetical protein